MTDAQFYYTTRKRGFGPFKKQIWDLPESVRNEISAELEVKFDLIFQRLNVVNSADLIDRMVKPVPHSKPAPAALEKATIS